MGNPSGITIGIKEIKVRIVFSAINVEDQRIKEKRPMEAVSQI